MTNKVNYTIKDNKMSQIKRYIEWLETQQKKEMAKETQPKKDEKQLKLFLMVTK